MAGKIDFIKSRSRKALLLLIDVFFFAVISAVLFVATKVFGTLTYSPFECVINTLILFPVAIAMRIVLKVYSSIWRYTNTLSYLRLFTADVVAVCIAMPVSLVCGVFPDVWFFALLASFSLLLTFASRFVYRFYYKRKKCVGDYSDADKIPVAIVGAGQLGTMLSQELVYSNSKYNPIFFVDNKLTKQGSKISDIPIYHNDPEKVTELIKKFKVKEVFITMSKLDNQKAGELFKFYSDLGCKVKVYDVPVKDFEEEQKESTSPRAIREFSIEDLLFRKAIKVNSAETRAYFSGKTVLVTGGGGSIGSELCRQIAKCSPKKLVIIDIYENNAYDIQQELIRKYGSSLDLDVEIASVRDRVRMEHLFDFYRPDIVFHAAAHKHVPLMERSATEAIKNNVLGTYNTADMAEKYGVEKFILVSTDKAVNPTNVMGASKRLCEMVIQCRTDSKTCFAAVRFGNVLGSNGSVIPLFKRQIAAGGPVTITDKRIIRYFMTIPEASQLVMEAGAMAKKGELFVLDMGKPVRIYDLAENMIRLSGFEPNKDIMIEEIGLRPGEKLYEELLMKTETLTATNNSKIFVEKDTPLSREEMEERLDLLRKAVAESAVENANGIIKDAIKKVVPTFREPEDVNKNAAESDEMKTAVGAKN